MFHDGHADMALANAALQSRLSSTALWWDRTMRTRDRAWPRNRDESFKP